MPRQLAPALAQLKPEDRKIIQAMADEFNEQLLTDIRRMRPALREGETTTDAAE